MNNLCGGGVIEHRFRLQSLHYAQKSLLHRYIIFSYNIISVKKLQRNFHTAEEIERQNFLVYSSAVRLSHEKERSRAERTKYWSIIGSVTGTVIGKYVSEICYMITTQTVAMEPTFLIILTLR